MPVKQTLESVWRAPFEKRPNALGLVIKTNKENPHE